MTLQTHHSAGVAESHHEEHYQQQYGEVGPEVVGKQVDEQTLPLGCREGIAPGCKGGEIMGPTLHVYLWRDCRLHFIACYVDLVGEGLGTRLERLHTTIMCINGETAHYNHVH